MRDPYLHLCTAPTLRKDATLTAWGEEGDELGGTTGCRAVLRADTVVATPNKYADATQAELREQAANILRIFSRAGILGVGIRYADRLWDLPAGGITEKGNEPVTRSHRPMASAEEDDRGWKSHGLSVLDVHVRLGIWVRRVVPSALDLYYLESRANALRAVFGHECLQVRRAWVMR